MKAKHTAKGAALTRLILEVFRVNGRLLASGDRLMKPLGQTSSRWQVMGAIEDEAATVPQIGRVMGISRQSVQRTADILVADGLCQYRENPHHRKSPLLALTKKGVELLAKMSRIQIEWANHLASSLKEREIHLAAKVLETLRAEEPERSQL